MPRIITALMFALVCHAALAAAPADPPDPLNSGRWADMRKEVLPADARTVFDERIRVIAPISAENPLNVPITVDASALDGVEEVRVFADYNPIVQIVRFEPGGALATLGFRVKLQQSTPIRAAARGADGLWHVGGSWVNTTGGGCTLPSTGSSSPEWQRRLGEVSSRVWARKEGGERIRLRIVHPEDTGLAAGIPAFYIEDLRLTDDGGRPLMRVRGFEPIAENPVFTVDIPAAHTGHGYRINGRDNNGNTIAAEIDK
ncbi:MAG TPA: quinoprotein dehydrogenase-associated SoxYZ-like carrier [Zoogloea sp.]|mgnify:FL=1|uniref:quinoprotein dehydrogenase-associated SoxYZ-like carrier n=1 Tax=Zoogloea sp. TaxID=49181 RepID=UPI002C6F8C7A|nr:quinoprotein dehydrogenase-associated SoxYZ-like carrier [Zoogloea sp.]HMV17136.1 quinoprotein dehydrogenase-associated SoxYZ-like carrier [Rhodocyclaceae bacterium]HMV62178.1 quinoprotein dehydrogenase-associated SoxYZ-like carrier [Rhodocyclaceae bacterium]HMW53689.1 quinoprotein dehydrogenase-associated SoxYZ-like carrier [Rhodocyclaceae bacterium]HMY51209.1 quinoprotein dehydrogenase-associated SoxYZ-like carrier [Rhodocyclaceae bacterium]HMZ75101.1 quinoprotein dehydrogenase-associated